KEPLRCCPGEGLPRKGCFCHASRASITSAAPTTLTQPTHDLAAGAASLRERSARQSLRDTRLKSKGFVAPNCENPLTSPRRTVHRALQFRIRARLGGAPAAISRAPVLGRISPRR